MCTAVSVCRISISVHKIIGLLASWVEPSVNRITVTWSIYSCPSVRQAGFSNKEQTCIRDSSPLASHRPRARTLALGTWQLSLESCPARPGRIRSARILFPTGQVQEMPCGRALYLISTHLSCTHMLPLIFERRTRIVLRGLMQRDRIAQSDTARALDTWNGHQHSNMCHKPGLQAAASLARTIAPCQSRETRACIGHRTSFIHWTAQHSAQRI